MSPLARRKLVLLALTSSFLPLALAAGCGGGGSAAPPASGASGGFTVKLLDQDPPASQVSGGVNDGPTPPRVIWEQSAKDGACALFKPRVPFCSTACTFPDVCVEDDTCAAEPTAQNVGTVTFNGIKTAAGGASIVLTKTDTNSYGSGESLAFPPFDEGADVSVEATGGVYPAFSIHAKGIAPLVLAATPLTLTKGQPLTLTWTAKGPSSDATIQVALDISHHGGTKGKIECTAPDNGSLTIGASLVTPLVNLGVSGFPSIDVTRASTGSTPLAGGTVQLNLVEVVQRLVMIPGLLSCTEDSECPTGQTCQTDLQCK